jgi:hypothetical protein
MKLSAIQADYIAAMTRATNERDELAESASPAISFWPGCRAAAW